MSRHTNPQRSSCWHVSALVASLVISPGMTSAAPDDHPNPSVQRALALLEAPAPVPIDVIDVRKLPDALRQMVKRSCAYVQKGIPRISINSSCPVYLAAGGSLLDAMKLAAILRHEMAHLDGANEAAAYMREAATFRELLGRAPRHLLSPGLVYACHLERRAATLPVQHH